VLIRRAELAGGLQRDVRLAGGRIAEIGDGLEPAPGEPTLDAAGGALLPGLHDHHIHLLALAAARRSLRCGPPEVRSAAALAAALRGAAPRDGWIRGVGYHDSVSGSLDRVVLDGLRAEVPVRVQHRSGALWVVNSAGAARLGLDAAGAVPGIERDASGVATGRLHRLDGWLRERLPSAAPDLAPLARELAARGVTGFTDATPGNGEAELGVFSEAIASGALPQRVVLMGSASLPDVQRDPLARGALKLILAEDALPAPEALAGAIADAHAEGRCVALHCVTRAELVVAVAAFAAAGAQAGDRIEHAAVAPPDVVQELAKLPLTVVTQPNFVRERGDAYLAEVEARDRPWLYRCRGWLDAGVSLGGGTDAPFGDADPWLAMAAAVARRSESGAVLAADEALSPERALALFTTHPSDPGGPPRALGEGASADLCLLGASWRVVRRSLASAPVRATFRAGEVVFRADAP